MNSVAITPVAERAGAERKAAEAAAPRPAKEERAARKESARGADTRPPIDKLAPGQTAARAKEKPDHSFFNVVVITTVAVLAAFAVGRSGKYTAGDDVGYYIGLTGGVLMLLLLLYPLRKHVAALRNWGKVKYWFAVHMVLGISGPVLVLAHSTFHMRSTNAAVALVCMLVVAGSGIIGRYLYTKVHRGLYGEKLNLKELRTAAGLESEEIRSRLHFVPGVEKQLEEFQAYALAPMPGFAANFRRFLTIGARRHRLQRDCLAELHTALQGAAEARGWDKAKLRRRHGAAGDLVKEYLRASQRIAEFGVYDSLLELWHVAHVPLVYLLVISGIAHVVAVHMY